MQTTTTVCGYGFEIGDPDFGLILKFLENHGHTLIKLKNEAGKIALDAIEKIDKDNIKSLDDIDDALYDTISKLSEWDLDQYMLRDVITEIIDEESEINFEFQIAQEDCEGNPCIGLFETYPWNYTEKERMLTQGDVDEILLPYMHELGINLPCLDWLKVEYYG